MLYDNIRYTLRSLARNPGFAAIAILSLGLGIGANTAVFTLLDRVLLRSLPVRDPHQLVIFKSGGSRQGSVDANYGSDYTFSYPLYQDFRDRAPGLSSTAAWFTIDASVQTGGQTERVEANLVTGNFFETLGTGASLGRQIVPDDAPASGANAVAVLSYRFWQQAFGGEPGVLNRKIDVNGQPLTIVGVAARGFDGPAVGEIPALYIPLPMQPQLAPGTDKMTSRRSAWLNIIARLKPGVSRVAEESALNAFWRPILAAELAAIPAKSEQTRRNFLNRRIVLLDASNGISVLRMMFEQPLTLLMGLVGLVLLIACANVANLLIARAAQRQKEIAIRMAVGATGGAIVRQILTEGLILSLAGGALGLLLAAWTGAALLQFLPFGSLSAGISADPDWRILAFTAAVSLGCGIVFGLVPALQHRRPDLAVAMKAQAGGVLSVGSHVFVRKSLVVAQVSVSLLLLSGAGLFLRSLDNLRRIDLGFRPAHLIQFSVNPPLAGPRRAQVAAAMTSLQARLSSIPGVTDVASSQRQLLSGSTWAAGVYDPGYQPAEGENAPNVNAVGAGYFAAMGIPLLRGRDFRASDDAGAPHVAIVNQTFAQQYFGTENALGRQFYLSKDRKTPIEVVGVARDGKYADLREAKLRLFFYPYAQQFDSGMGGMTFYLRSAQESGQVIAAAREIVKQADATLPIFDVKTMDRQIDEDLFADRIVSALSTFFGVLATALAGLGLYGVLSYTVARRTREIGIRMALGAGRRQVLLLILREVAFMTALGIALAVPLFYEFAGVTRSMLYSVAPHDVWTLLGAAAVLGSAALLAGCIPASRASRIDPLVALRID